MQCNQAITLKRLFTLTTEQKRPQPAGVAFSLKHQQQALKSL
jgi:hypothetical protein